jgi:putative phosphoribosyl transferase
VKGGDVAPYKDRTDAGQKLVELIKARLPPLGSEVVVLGLPRGGVPVAYEVARELNAPLDVFIVRKLGTPGNPELAMGAIASGGVRVLNQSVIHSLGISSAQIEQVAEKETRELQRREVVYRDDRPFPEIRDKTVLLVDDGLATGATMRAAVEALRQQEPARIIVAVPVAAQETCAEVGADVDAIICGETPEPFYGVGMWYRDFSQTTDSEVHDLLERSSQQAAARSGRIGG